MTLEDDSIKLKTKLAKTEINHLLSSGMRHFIVLKPSAWLTEVLFDVMTCSS